MKIIGQSVQVVRRCGGRQIFLALGTTLDEVQGKRMKDGTCFVCIV